MAAPILFAASGLAQPPAPPAITYQTGCWDGSGGAIPCAGTGQDGELQRGVEAPEPRFVDNEDGTILDRLTGLTWLKRGDCFNDLTWTQIFPAVSGLASGACDLSDSSSSGDWRVPNINELVSLFDYRNGQNTPSMFPGSLRPLLWSSTSDPATHQAWSTSLGNVNLIGKTQHGVELGVLPVRAAAPALAPAPVARTGQTLCYNEIAEVISCEGTGHDGDIRGGAAWPSPRFEDNLDGTITDLLTGLVWLKYAYCYGWNSNFQQALDRAHALQHGQCDLADGSQPGEWRLPSANELRSLGYYGSLPDGWPFYAFNGAVYCTSTNYGVAYLVVSGGRPSWYEKSTGLSFNCSFIAVKTKPLLRAALNDSAAGQVESSPGGIDCGVDCWEEYSEGSNILLLSNPETGYLFSGWSGHSDCLDGQVTMNGDRRCVAEFVSTIFSDGFEDGNTLAWSQTVLN